MSLLDECPLTKGELEVVQLLGSGMTYGQIAEQTRRSTSTIRTHCHRVYKKLGVPDRAQAVLVCTGRGWVGSRAAPAHIIEQQRVGLLREIRDDQRKLLQLINKGKLGKLKPVHRRYLRALDGFLLAKNESEEKERRADMLAALAALAPPERAIDWHDRLHDDRRIT